MLNSKQTEKIFDRVSEIAQRQVLRGKGFHTWRESNWVIIEAVVLANEETAIERNQPEAFTIEIARYCEHGEPAPQTELADNQVILPLTNVDVNDEERWTMFAELLEEVLENSLF